MKIGILKQRSATIAGSIAALVATLILPTTIPSAAAATIDGGVTSVTVNSVVDRQWDQVDLDCAWEVPDKSAPGDTFSLQLPPELRWFGSPEFDLLSPEGEAVATGVAGQTGLVVFTLTDYVEQHPYDVSGTCKFSTQFVQSPGQPGTVDLQFSSGSQLLPAPVTIVPCVADCAVTLPTSPGKSMWWINASQTRLESIFYMPALTDAANDIVIVDTPAGGMVIDCAAVVPRVGRHLDRDGNIAPPFDDDVYPAIEECTPQELTVRWNNLPAGHHVELFVVTEVTDSSALSYSNTGVVTVNGTSVPVGDTALRAVASGTGAGHVAPTPKPTPTPTPSPTPEPTESPAAPVTPKPSHPAAPEPSEPITAAPGTSPETPVPTASSRPIPDVSQGSLETKPSGVHTGTLAETGSATVPLLWSAFLLVAAGVSALLLMRKRRGNS